MDICVQERSAVATTERVNRERERDGDVRCAPCTSFLRSANSVTFGQDYQAPVEKWESTDIQECCSGMEAWFPWPGGV